LDIIVAENPLVPGARDYFKGLSKGVCRHLVTKEQHFSAMLIKTAMIKSKYLVIKAKILHYQKQRTKDFLTLQIY
jgi:hypothetical protein